MLRGVLFDLDGTLLRIDLEAFLSEYFHALGPVLASLSDDGATPEDALSAVVEATNAMCAPHPERTNRDVFHTIYAEKTGVDLDAPEPAEVLDRFYREVFPSLQRDHGPRGGARSAVEAAKSAGFEVVVATNPIFPRAAIVERLRWAGFEPSEFAGITSYESMQACKPFPVYFRQAAALAGLKPEECLMVGDDRALDAAAADVGMRVFYVGPVPAPPTDWAGTMEDVTELLGRLEAPRSSSA